VAHLDYPLFIVNKSKINLNMKQILPLCIVLLLFALHTQAQTPEEKLKALNIELPAVKAPIANYVHVVRTGNLLYLSGKGPSDANGN
jgi:hypothetical protein